MNLSNVVMMRSEEPHNNHQDMAPEQDLKRKAIKVQINRGNKVGLGSQAVTTEDTKESKAGKIEISENSLCTIYIAHNKESTLVTSILQIGNATSKNFERACVGPHKRQMKLSDNILNRLKRNKLKCAEIINRNNAVSNNKNRDKKSTIVNIEEVLIKTLTKK